MKKIKTIIGILFLSLIVMGYQTSDEFTEFEIVNSKTYDTNRNSNLNSVSQTVSLRVVFNPFLNQLQRNDIRFQFEQLGLGLVNFQSCSSPNEEFWEVDYISFNSLLSMSSNIIVVPASTTAAGTKPSDDYPDPTGIIKTRNFIIYYGASCS